MAEFDDCFTDFLRALGKEELSDLKTYLQNSKGLVSHEVNEALAKVGRLDDWLVTLEGEVGRLEHKIKKYAEQYGVMPFVDFLDCVNVADMSDDLRSMVEGYIDKYFDFKYNMVNTASVKTWLEKGNLYRKELESRITEYIEVIDSVLAEKIGVL